MPKSSCCSKEGCKKKLGLTPFQCRCEKHFCSTHRYPEEHACTFDYQASAKQDLLKYMSSPVIAPKVAIL